MQNQNQANIRSSAYAHGYQEGFHNGYEEGRTAGYACGQLEADQLVQNTKDSVQAIISVAATILQQASLRASQLAFQEKHSSRQKPRSRSPRRDPRAP